MVTITIVVAARLFFERAISLHGMPESIPIHKSGANTMATEVLCNDSGDDIQLRQPKVFSNLIEQYHRTIKRLFKPMLGFKTVLLHASKLPASKSCTICRKGTSAVITHPNVSSRAILLFGLFIHIEGDFAEQSLTITTEPIFEGC
jgi:transposase-like protein